MFPQILEIVSRLTRMLYQYLQSGHRIHWLFPWDCTHKQAFEILQKKLRYFRQALQKFRENRQSLMNRDKTYHGYIAGQIVYLYFPGKTAMLHTGSRKIRCNFVGPLAIWKCVGPTQFILISLDGKLYPYLIEENRINQVSLELQREMLLQ